MHGCNRQCGNRQRRLVQSTSHIMHTHIGYKYFSYPRFMRLSSHSQTGFKFPLASLFVSHFLTNKNLVAQISSTEKIWTGKQYFNFQKYATLNFWPERAALRVSSHTPFWLLCAIQFTQIVQYVLAALCESVRTDCTIHSVCSVRVSSHTERPQ